MFAACNFGRLVALSCLVVTTFVHASNFNPTRFVIVSSPLHAKISYTVPEQGPAMYNLISGNLGHPQGIAVDQKRSLLFVTDPDVRKIYSYKLTANGNSLSAGGQTVVSEGAEARWVTVDSTGNVFFSDEANNQINKISSERLLRFNKTGEPVYTGQALKVSSPGGIATDNFFTYWANKALGTKTGSVMRGMSSPGAGVAPSALVQSLATNTDLSYGVCMAMGNIYYTQKEKVIYGVKKDGGGGLPVTITDRLTNPRGCAWDGDGTVYVADRGANSIYSFAGNMRTLSAVQVSKVADFEGAFGIAVYSSALRSFPFFWCLVVTALAVLSV